MLFSIGHSNRTQDALIDLLIRNRIDMLADIRHYPASRHNPQFNGPEMLRVLPPHGIDYCHIEGLGGRRYTPVGTPSPHTYWTSRAFRSYADYAMTEPFAEGLEQLRALASKGRVAFMCAEVQWWRCHRRIVTDYLMAAREPVSHIMSEAPPSRARLNPAVRQTPQGLLYLG